MPPLQSYKRRRVACQHFPDDQTLRLETGAGEDDIIYLPSGLDRVDCERQEKEEEEIPVLLAQIHKISDLKDVWERNASSKLPQSRRGHSFFPWGDAWCNG